MQKKKCTIKGRDQTPKGELIDSIERFNNTVRRHSTFGYLSPDEFEQKTGLA
jgi:putative transposase